MCVIIDFIYLYVQKVNQFVLLIACLLVFAVGRISISFQLIHFLDVVFNVRLRVLLFVSI